jgi:hypothetical protein
MVFYELLVNYEFFWTISTVIDLLINKNNWDTIQELSNRTFFNF